MNREWLRLAVRQILIDALCWLVGIVVVGVAVYAGWMLIRGG
jgi:hypothetical protein